MDEEERLTFAIADELIAVEGHEEADTGPPEARQRLRIRTDSGDIVIYAHSGGKVTGSVPADVAMAIEHEVAPEPGSEEPEWVSPLPPFEQQRPVKARVVKTLATLLKKRGLGRRQAAEMASMSTHALQALTGLRATETLMLEQLYLVCRALDFSLVDVIDGLGVNVRAWDTTTPPLQALEIDVRWRLLQLRLASRLSNRRIGFATECPKCGSSQDHSYASRAETTLAVNLVRIERLTVAYGASLRDLFAPPEVVNG